MVKIIAGMNDLYTLCLQNNQVDLMKQWDTQLNEQDGLYPNALAYTSHAKAHWCMDYFDINKQKQFHFKWVAPIKDRTVGNQGCPYLNGRQVCRGFNDLYTWCVENNKMELIQEWHPTKNGDLTPYNVTPTSGKEIVWYKPYDDPKTGRHFDFEWTRQLKVRTSQNQGCPYLSSNDVWYGYNDFETWCKDNNRLDLLREWHPTKNGDLTPRNVMMGSHKKIWWLQKQVVNGKEVEFEWESVLYARTLQNQKGPLHGTRIVVEHLNDFETWCKTNDRQDLLNQWHPTKNGDRSPKDFRMNSNTKVWWLYSYTDIKTNRHFDFEWEARIADRVNGTNCPYLTTNAKVWYGFNDLETWCKDNNRLDLLAEWHPTKNGALTPAQVTYASNQQVCWLKDNVEWTTQIWQRTIYKANSPKNGHNQYSQKYVENSFKYWCENNVDFTYLLTQWDYDLNCIKPEEISKGSNKPIHWILSYDDTKTLKHFDFKWICSIKERLNQIQKSKNTKYDSIYAGCPYLCVSPVVWSGFNDLETWCKDNDRLDLLQEWDYDENDVKPNEILYSSKKEIHWVKIFKNPKNNELQTYKWISRLHNRTLHNSDCPQLTGSSMERFLYNWCAENNFDYVAEKRFEDLARKPFDLYLSEYNLIVEADGLQHFISEPRFFDKSSDLASRKHNDNEKNQYCLDNNIPILRIPYTYDVVKHKKTLDNMLIKFITTRQVPIQILDFYADIDDCNYVEIAKKLNKKNK